jgi:hypothetical protein
MEKADATGIAGIVVGVGIAIAAYAVPWELSIIARHITFWSGLACVIAGTLWLIKLHSTKSRKGTRLLLTGIVSCYIALIVLVESLSNTRVVSRRTQFSYYPSEQLITYTHDFTRKLRDFELKRDAITDMYPIYKSGLTPSQEHQFFEDEEAKSEQARHEIEREFSQDYYQISADLDIEMSQRACSKPLAPIEQPNPSDAQSVIGYLRDQSAIVVLFGGALVGAEPLYALAERLDRLATKLPGRCEHE